MTLLQNRNIPLKCVFSKSRFILVDIRPTYEFDETTKKSTKKIVGYKYIVIETYKYTRFDVKVVQSTPLMTADELEQRRDSGEKVFVDFNNATIKPYYSSRTKQLEDSITADEIILADMDDISLELD